MKIKFLISVLSLIFSVESVFALSGLDIMKKNKELKEPKSSKTVISMTINRRGGRVEKKEFEAIQKKINGEDRVLMEFIKPTTIKFLTHSKEGTDSKQWIKRKSGGVKRIASRDKGKQFVHSHFFYEDMGAHHLKDHTYKSLGSATVNGTACYKVEAIKKSKKVYDKIIIFLRKSDYYVIKTEFYQKGKLQKSLEMFDIEVIKGIITAKKLIMKMAGKDEKTILKLKSVKYNIKIPSSKFRSAGM